LSCGVLTSDKVETVDSLGARGEIAAVVSNLAFLVGQVILIPRLYRKRYRSFRVEISREDGASNGLSAREVMRVGIRLVWRQAVYMVLTAIAAASASAAMDPQAARGVGSLFFWMRFLLIGPYAVHFAIPKAIRASACKHTDSDSFERAPPSLVLKWA
jgi:hypothetical protein